MSIDKVSVNPCIGLGRQLTGHKFSRRKHGLAVFVVNRVSVHIDAVEVVIEPYGLNLFIGLKQRYFVPHSNIFNSGAVFFEILKAQSVVDVKVHLLNPVKIVGVSGMSDVVGYIIGFLCQLIGFYYEFLGKNRSYEG